MTGREALAANPGTSLSVFGLVPCAARSTRHLPPIVPCCPRRPPATRAARAAQPTDT